MNYKKHKNKIILAILFFSISLILIMELYHFYGRKQVLYKVSVEKLLIITKTLRYYNVKQKKLYDERFKKIQSKSKIIKYIEQKNTIALQKEVEELSGFFKSSTPYLEHLHIYDINLELLYYGYQKHLKHINYQQNPVLLEVQKTKKSQIGYVKISDNEYYKSMIYPLQKNNKIIAYIEFGIKADNLYKIISKAGRYKYALYLNDNRYDKDRKLGKKVASNSKLFNQLKINQAFIYKYANRDSLVQHQNKYYLFFQYDIESSFQKNFAQVLIAKDVTNYVEENINRVITTLEIAIVALLIIALFVYLYLTKLINKIIKEEEELNIKQQQLKTIIDNSENLITMFHEYQLILVNNSFLEFLKCNNLELFINKHSNIGLLFEEKNDTYKPTKLDNNFSWIHELEQLNKEDRIVALKHYKYGINYFSVNITLVPKQPESIIITFSNITSIFIKSTESQYKANHDTLTNIYNRNYFNELTKNLIINKQALNASLIMLDLDFFKQVNDTYGHQKGDYVLKRFTTIISNNIRTTDIFARWGGEEFVVLLKNTPEKTAYRISQHLKVKVKQSNFEEIGNITCSIGLSQYKNGDNLESWLKRTDEALYKAKQNGRNRVEII